MVSMDGSNFVRANFGANYVVRDGYTVLESNTGNVFVQMIQSNSIGSEHGTLFKSNWNGTNFRLILDGVNQNRNGFVDFEKIAGINGTIMVNQISNVAGLPKGDPKRLVSKISFDDGDNWVRVRGPTKDSKGISYNCGDTCYLNLHAFTERHDRRDSYSSAGAVGLLLGVGNVGDSLTDFINGDVFRSIDAGRTWTEIAKEAHMIEIADHGGVIVMVNDEETVTSVKYSLDYGTMFRDFSIDRDLQGSKMRIQNIITEPSGTTSHFVLFGRVRNSVNDTTVAIHLDFSKIWSRMCKVENDDFERWSPFNISISSSSCVFGERVEFMRRKHDRECYIGDTYKQLEVIRTPCECTIADFECDQYHYLEGEKCLALPGVQIPEAKCINGIMKRPTGYVKKKISMCKGGLELHIDPNAQRCSTSSISWGLFFIITLPLTAGAAYILYLYQKGGLGRYGHIALPLDDYGRPRTFMQRFWMFASTFASDIGTNISSGLASLWSWIQQKLNRGNGYEPLNTHYFDAGLPTSSAVELDWDDVEE